MNVLVTGAAGMVGTHLVAAMAPDHEVVALTRDEPPASGPDVTWVRQDLTEPLDLGALPDKIDAAVHLAQSDRYRDFPDGAEDVFEVNVHSTQRLLEYAQSAGASHFVLASSGGVYERAPEPRTEDSPIAAPNPYFRSKRMAELLAANYSDLLTTVVFRFFFIYGPGDGLTLVPRLTRQILDGEEITIEGDPGMRMNPLFVGDAVAAIEAGLVLGESAVVNAAGSEVVSITELVERLGAALGREPKVTHTDAPAGASDLVADTSTMKEMLGVEPATKLEAGLRETTAPFVGA